MPPGSKIAILGYTYREAHRRSTTLTGPCTREDECRSVTLVRGLAETRAGSIKVTAAHTGQPSSGCQYTQQGWCRGVRGISHGPDATECLFLWKRGLRMQQRDLHSKTNGRIWASLELGVPCSSETTKPAALHKIPNVQRSIHTEVVGSREAGNGDLDAVSDTPG